MEANKIEGPFPFLLKTMKSEYVEDTMKYGRFCFNHPSIFNKWENTQAAQYDKWEAHSAFNATHLMYYPSVGEKDGYLIYGEGLNFADKAIVREQTEEAKHSPICCFRIVEENEINPIPDGIEFSLGEIADRIISEFNHDAFILIEARPFLSRLQEKYRFAGNVVYRDTTNDYNFDVPDQYKHIVEQLFRKDKRFSWQKEYRIVLPPSAEPKVFIEIGAIKDIAISGMISELRK